MLGTKYWNNKEKIYFDQTNNALEAFIQKIKRMEKLQGGYLNSCGLESACCCMAAIYNNPFYNIKEGIQPGDILFAYMNNPLNYNFFDSQLIKGHRSIPGNMISELYPLSVSKCFDANALIYENLSWDMFCEHIKNGEAIQFAFYNPNHYNAAVAYDEDNKTIKRCDPWPGNPINKNKGWLEDLTEKEFIENVKPKFIIYSE